MGSFNWFGLYLNEVGQGFQLELSPDLLQRRRQILVRFVFDFMLNHLVFGTLNIAVWRGVWGYAFYYFTLVSSSPELTGSLKLGNVWVFVWLIFCPRWPMNQLNKNPNIA